MKLLLLMFVLSLILLTNVAVPAKVEQLKPTTITTPTTATTTNTTTKYVTVKVKRNLDTFIAGPFHTSVDRFVNIERKLSFCTKRNASCIDNCVWCICPKGITFVSYDHGCTDDPAVIPGGDKCLLIQGHIPIIEKYLQGCVKIGLPIPLDYKCMISVIHSIHPGNGSLIQEKADFVEIGSTNCLKCADPHCANFPEGRLLKVLIQCNMLQDPTDITEQCFLFKKSGTQMTSLSWNGPIFPTSSPTSPPITTTTTILPVTVKNTTKPVNTTTVPETNTTTSTPTTGTKYTNSSTSTTTNTTLSNTTTTTAVTTVPTTTTKITTPMTEKSTSTTTVENPTTPTNATATTTTIATSEPKTSKQFIKTEDFTRTPLENVTIEKEITSKDKEKIPGVYIIVGFTGLVVLAGLLVCFISMKKNKKRKTDEYQNGKTVQYSNNGESEYAVIIEKTGRQSKGFDNNGLECENTYYSSGPGMNSETRMQSIPDENFYAEPQNRWPCLQENVLYEHSKPLYDHIGSNGC